MGRMAPDSVQDMATCVITAAGSILWIPTALGVDPIDAVGTEPGIMGATLIGAAGVYSVLDKFDVLD